MALEMFFKDIIKIIKLKQSLILGISVLISALLYIFTPIILNEPTIRLSTGKFNSFRIILPKDFETCTLAFNNDVFISKYLMQYSPGDEKFKVIKPKEMKIDQTLVNLNIKNLLEKSKTSIKDQKTSIIVTIHHRTPSPIELCSAKIDENSVDFKQFYEKNIIAVDKKYVKYRYIREGISLFLLKYNDPVSNVILTTLTIFLIPLTYGLIKQIWCFYFARNPETIFKKRNNFSCEKDIENARISYSEKYSLKENWFRFLQVFGPAIGFALTTSSLVVGLHPSLREAQDITKFFETIQIAMISTFIGLLIRIIAMFSQKLNNKLFIQADEYFFNLTQQLNTNSNE